MKDQLIHFIEREGEEDGKRIWKDWYIETKRRAGIID
jgi:hypothetical protein